MNQINEHYNFISHNGYSIYTGMYSKKNKSSYDHGVILCKPIWGERIRLHRIYTNLARMLASQGYFVCTFDYYADGNSSGETHELTYDGMVANVVKMSEYLRIEHKIKNISLVGLRMGGSIALSAGKEIDNLEKVLVFEPIFKLKQFAFDSLRINLTMQMMRYKKIIKNRKQLVEDLDRGERISIDGFIIDKKFYSSLIDNSPVQIPENSKKIYLSFLEKNKNKKEIQSLIEEQGMDNIVFLPKEFDWSAWKIYEQYPENFFKWINSILKAEVLKSEVK